MVIKAALLIFRGKGPRRALLLVKPRDKPYWVFPGGKQERRESLHATLKREIREELEAEVADATEFSVFRGETPEGAPLRLHLFCGRLDGSPKPAGEIASIRWVTKSELPAMETELTPITMRKILPLVESAELW